MNDIKNYKVYIHIFPDKKVYIGITRQDINARWGKDGNGYKGQKVYDAILKYGWCNIEHKILYDNLSSDEARKKEIELIKQYNAIENGYNIDEGGGLGSSETNIKIKYNDVFYSPSELLQFSTVKNLKEKDIITRISRGWDMDRVLTQEKMPKNDKYEYNGNYYTTTELAKLSNVEGIKPQHIKNRIDKCGFTVERAITQPLNVKLQPFPTKDIRFSFNNNEYTIDELTEMSNVDGITGYIIYRRILKGWSIERAITQRVRIVNDRYIYNGIEYKIDELTKISKYNLSPEVIRSRIKSGWSIDDAINKPRQHKKTYIYNDKEYTLDELFKMCTFKNPTKQTLLSRLNSGMDVGEAISKEQNAGKKKYEYNGDYYYISELLKFAQYDSITKKVLQKRLRSNIPIDIALSTPVKSRKIKSEENK